MGLAAFPLAAQEPRPADLSWSDLGDPTGVPLDFAWRFAPGGDPGRAAPGFDDANWVSIRPVLASGGLPAGGWPGVGWFRRHLVIEPSLQNRLVALRFGAPGQADVYLDGRLVLRCGGGAASPEIPWERQEASLITFVGPRHALAVRYQYPKAGEANPNGIGFRLSLADPALAAGAATIPWKIGAEGAIAALPALLVLFHLILFGFNPRARENLFYACEMLAFTVIVLQEFHIDLLATDAQRQLFDSLAAGAPIIAIVFGLLTYYAVRTHPYPKTWQLFVAVGAVLFVLTYLLPGLHEISLDLFFVTLVIEVVRVERTGRTIPRKGARFFLASLVVFMLAVSLQILINNGLLASVGGVHAVYIVGILASAVGMSLYLAHGLGQSRLLELENTRKSLELARARELQLSMLPRNLPRAAGLDIAAATHTAAEVGGDYYDVRPAGDGALLVAFGDATGHGLPSGIIVTAAKALFGSLSPDGDLSQQMISCGRVLRDMRLPGFRMCLALARVSSTGITIASAAMPPLLIHRAKSGAIEELGAGGLPLGTRLPARYEEQRGEFLPGDTMLFASDGFAELLDPDGNVLGYEGATGAFREAAGGESAREVLDRLAEKAVSFRGARAQDDDITFVVIRVDKGEG
jgi:serine phosphatase RsbU (regulator of sigma subunit)